MKTKSFVAALICIAVLLCAFASCGKKTEAGEEKEITLEEALTPTSATLVGADEKSAELFEEKAKEYDSKLDPSGADSEISSLNNSKDSAVLSEFGKNFLLESIRLSGETGGKLDLTLLPLIRLWGFDQGEKKVPEELLISMLISKSGMDQIQVNEDQVTLGKFTMLDLSVTENGYLADLLASDLYQSGSPGGKITKGNVTKTYGNRGDSSSWEIVIPHPKDSGKTLGVLTARGECAVATAGIYDNYFISDDTHYCNIIDPATGYPVQNDLVSATVVSRSGLRADGFATALMVMGSEGAISFYKEKNNFDMILVLKNGSVLVTSSLAKTFSLSDGSSFQVIEK